jgi:hypothetical protein
MVSHKKRIKTEEVRRHNEKYVAEKKRLSFLTSEQRTREIIVKAINDVLLTIK